MTFNDISSLISLVLTIILFRVEYSRIQKTFQNDLTALEVKNFKKELKRFHSIFKRLDKCQGESVLYIAWLAERVCVFITWAISSLGIFCVALCPIGWMRLILFIPFAYHFSRAIRTIQEIHHFPILLSIIKDGFSGEEMDWDFIVEESGGVEQALKNLKSR